MPAGEAPLISNGFSTFLVNTDIGGINVPYKLVHMTQVIFDPRSADATVPINFLFLSASV